MNTLAKLTAALPEEARAIAARAIHHGGRRWGLYLPNLGSFTHTLLGLLAADRDIVLLPSNLPEMVTEAAAELDGLILDKPLPESLAEKALPASASADTSLPPLQDRTGRIAFYTSGSTGAGREISKTLSQLETETKALELLWGTAMNKAIVLSTVTHQHIYGFLFRFLWPLLTGRQAPADTVPLLQDLKDTFRGHAPCVLISCPAHLRRLPDLTDLASSRGSVVEIFSSGGPLHESTALRIAADLGKAPIEVFGSTETGGVAWRQRSPEEPDPEWHAFPGVSVRQGKDGCLEVRSRFTGTPDAFPMSDLCEITGADTFRLGGRADRIVKVEQKRISLDQVEHHLRRSRLVDDAAAAVLEGTAFRDTLGVAVQLSPEGRRQLTGKGRRNLVQALRDQLAGYFEAVTLPRRWAFVTELPRNPQGKVPADAVRDCLDDQSPWLPQVLDRKADDHALVIQARVPDDLVYFDGHFDELPVVAGVVQLHWALAFGQEAFGFKPDIKSMESIKFHRLMLKSDPFQLSLEWQPDRSLLMFTYRQDETLFSSGRLFLHA